MNKLLKNIFSIKDKKYLKNSTLFLLIISIILTTGCSSNKQELLDRDEQIESLETENEKLKTSNGKLEENFNNDKQKLESEKESLREEIDKLREEIKELQKQIGDLEAKKEEERKAKEIELAKKAEEEKKAKESAAAASKAPNPNTASTNTSQTTSGSKQPAKQGVDKTAQILRTKSGKMYHKRKCGNGNFYATTLDKAKASGLKACSKCF